MSGRSILPTIAPPAWPPQPQSSSWPVSPTVVDGWSQGHAANQTVVSYFAIASIRTMFTFAGILFLSPFVESLPQTANIIAFVLLVAELLTAYRSLKSARRRGQSRVDRCESRVLRRRLRVVARGQRGPGVVGAVAARCRQQGRTRPAGFAHPYDMGLFGYHRCRFHAPGRPCTKLAQRTRGRQVSGRGWPRLLPCVYSRGVGVERLC